MKRGFVVLALTLLSLAPLVAPDQSTGSLAALEAPGNDRQATSSLPPDTAAIQVVAAPAANIVQATSCAQEHVQAAIDTANDGDFVLVPAGSCTWTTPAPNTPAMGINGKSITLQGAGIGQTVITDGTGTGWGDTLLVVDGVEGKPFRITGFTFTEGNAPVLIHIGGDCKNFRVDHCQFALEQFLTGINVSGYTYGVVDHCQFINSRVYVREALAGDTPWQRPLTLGSANAVYIEDCDYYANVLANTVDSSGGARYVFRHNTVMNTYVESHGLHNEGMRGTFSYEVYENTFTAGAAGVVSHVAVSVRGGTGVIFNNTVVNDNPPPDGWVTGFGIMYDNRCCVTSHPWGLCDGSNWVDGNELANGYPCRDQIGRSTDYSDSQIHPQAYEPLYAWNNTLDGAPADMRPSWCASSQEHIQEGRDFFNGTPRPGYTPYVYPHPLTKDLVLSGAPADQTAYLGWMVRTILPVTTTWRITAYSQTVASALTTTVPLSTTRAYTLTNLTNYAWYTITLNAMVGTTPFLTDTVRVMAGHTCASDESGDWGQAGTWDCNAVPGAGELVIVSSGTTVTLDASARSYNLSVEPGASLVIPQGVTLTATGGVVNQGRMQQAQAVNDERAAFLEIGDGGGTIHHRGVEIDTPNELGTVTVTLRALASGEYCTTTGGGAPAYARRCFEVQAARTATATLRLWALHSEISPTVITPTIFRHSGDTWVELTDNTSSGTNGDYTYVQADTPGFSHFLIGQSGSAPTIVSQRELGADGQQAPNRLIIALVLALAAGVAFGLRLLWRRRYR